MKYTFSPKFRLPLYELLLHELGEEIENYRFISGTKIKEMMAILHISHPVLKKY